MKVYLFRGKHPLYESLISYPPQGIEYLPKTTQTGYEEYTLYGPSHSTLRSFADGTFSLLRIPRMTAILRRYDLVHSSRGFFVLGPNRFLVDIEHVSSFAGMRHENLSSSLLRRAIAKGLSWNRCCGVLPHCEAARRTLSLVTRDPKIMKKATVVYPCADPRLQKIPRRPHERLQILLMGEYFWKGGRELLNACVRLAAKEDFHLEYISLRVHPPQGVVERARRILDMGYHEGPVPRRILLEEIYPRTDVFAMPTYIDTFGYAFLEAMSYGIPSVGARHFAVPEIIQDDVTGILVNPVLSYFDSAGMGHPEFDIESADGTATSEALVSALSVLLGSKGLRNHMGREALKSIQEGKFSVPVRNSILKTAYEDCMRR